MKTGVVSVGLINPKSPENVDSVMRAAGNYRVDAVCYTGQRYSRALELNPKTPDMARKVSLGVALKGVSSLADCVGAQQQIICVEFAENAIPLPDFIHPQNAFYVFGPEDGNIDQQIIDSADSVVYVPTEGCMNLAATVNVVLYDRLAKSMQPFDNNVLIRHSRDTNNNLKVRN